MLGCILSLLLVTPVFGSDGTVRVSLRKRKLANPFGPTEPISTNLRTGGSSSVTLKNFMDAQVMLFFQPAACFVRCAVSHGHDSPSSPWS
jgi:hypothetical protein